MEKFLIGALVGGIAGALVVSNNAKMRTLVKKGEDELKEKVGSMVDEKLSAMLKKCDDAKSGAQESQTGEQQAQGGGESAPDESADKKKSKKKDSKKE